MYRSCDVDLTDGRMQVKERQGGGTDECDEKGKGKKQELKGKTRQSDVSEYNRQRWRKVRQCR